MEMVCKFKTISIIFLCFFLLFFSANTATGTIYTEDFNDGNIDAPFEINTTNYTISNGELHIIGGEPYNNTDLCEIGVYHFNGDYIYRVESSLLVLGPNPTDLTGISLQWYEDSNDNHGWKAHLKFDHTNGVFWAHYWNGTDAFDVNLESFNYNEWYDLSITFNTDSITYGINGSETELFKGSYQEPTSIYYSYGEIHSAIFPADGVDVYADNLSVYIKQVIPEPASMFLFSFGLLGIAGISRKKK
ncbi:PEP-CTERM sorting domain-containing protein [Desulfobacula sp.]|uniref:PEP-CTERM sorting domain-containing protein n=1 Tax=Desulfobacula sp. TaxID=2593537 RepID=UPI00262D7D4C|nr:PEP-CTERM sorting domain-containing protein [Desulfobacula sp.]